MEFNNFELTLLLLLVEGKIRELNMILRNLEFDKNYMDDLEYEKLSRSNGNALKSTQLLRAKIKKYLEE